MQGTYYNTTLTATFDRYKLVQYKFNNDQQTGYDVNIRLSNVTDQTTNAHYDTLELTMTKSFKRLGQIKDHPKLLITCRHYNEQQATHPERQGYAFVSNVTEISARKAWPNDKLTFVQDVMEFNHQQKLDDYYSLNFLNERE